MSDLLSASANLATAPALAVASSSLFLVLSFSLKNNHEKFKIHKIQRKHWLRFGEVPFGPVINQTSLLIKLTTSFQLFVDFEKLNHAMKFSLYTDIKYIQSMNVFQVSK